MYFGGPGCSKLHCRQWLVLDAKGDTEVVEAGKHAIMRRTGLPARDLRILDPLLSYPSTLLGRERAIVINLEHIKAIITAQEVLLLNSRDPSVTPFVQELQASIIRHHQASSSSKHLALDSDSDPDADAIKILPFEFVALETCLEAACNLLENEAKRLEQEAHPFLDKLTSKISILNLERVRQVKSRIVTVTGRVQKVRDELEQLLDDDEVMAEMYLSQKLAQQQLQAEEDIDPRDSHGTRGSTYSAATKHLDVKELEMLLEAYFVQIDGTLNKLSTLREYVHEMEEYINLMLNDKRNQLLQMTVKLTATTIVVNAFIFVARVFGMK